MKHGKQMLVKRIMTSVIGLNLCLMTGPLFAQDSMALAREALRNAGGAGSGLPASRLAQESGRLGQNGIGDDLPAMDDPNNKANPDVIKAQEAPSDLEKYMAGEKPDRNKIKDLTQFGYNVFNARKIQFDPVRNIPVGLDYIVGPGDSFTLTMWGRQND
ncbi:MAG: hypothetical protein K9N55_01725, partial [Phycisphaerae bacterium]|nr:hypothetical protein [Phycisphaerae bacterium]